MKVRVISIKSITVLMLGFVFADVSIGQDLGSSNKLFTGSKSTPAKARKAASKRSSAKPRAAVRKPAFVKKKPAKPTAAVTAPKSDSNTTVVIAPKKSAKEPNVVVSFGDAAQVVIGANSAETDQKYEELIELGDTQRLERNYGGAETAYRKANKLKPREPRAMLGLGNLYSDQQRWADAEKAFRSANDVAPNFVDLLVALSFILTRPVAASNLPERYAEAEKLARQAVKLDVQSAPAADQLGVALELSGEIGNETESAYRRSIQLDPNYAPAHAHLARLLRKKGKTAAASAAFADAASKAGDVGTKLQVADVLQSEGKFKESVDLLESALAADPRSPTALTMLGRAMMTQGKYIDAEKYLRKSIEISPSSFVSYSLLASLFVRQNKFETAESYLVQAIRYASLFDKRLLATQFESVGDGYARAGRSSAAVRAYRQASELDPGRETLAGKLAKFK